MDENEMRWLWISHPGESVSQPISYSYERRKKEKNVYDELAFHCGMEFIVHGLPHLSLMNNAVERNWENSRITSPFWTYFAMIQMAQTGIKRKILFGFADDCRLSYPCGLPENYQE